MTGSTKAASDAPPRWRASSRIPPAWLGAVALLSVTLWLGAEFAMRRPVHPRNAEMLNAARAMEAATVIETAATPTVTVGAGPMT